MTQALRSSKSPLSWFCLFPLLVFLFILQDRGWFCWDLSFFRDFYKKIVLTVTILLRKVARQFWERAI